MSERNEERIERIYKHFKDIKESLDGICVSTHVALGDNYGVLGLHEATEDFKKSLDLYESRVRIALETKVDG